MNRNHTRRLGVVATVLVLFFSTISFKADFFEIAKQLEIFTTLFKELNLNYVDETNPAELMDTAINAMLEDLDPYTHYWNEQEVQAARINNAGEYTGIGATVGIRNNKITIIEPYQDYPADKAGLKAGDEIIKIGDVTVADFTEDAGELLKGAPNSRVELTYNRQGEIKKTVLTRGAIEIKAVPFYKLIGDNTGYIVLSQFNRNASAETVQAFRELKEQGAEKIILDLRGNPGGLLSEAINVANIFIPEGELITSTKSAVEKYNQTFFTTRKAIDSEIPLAVLINGRSASASEIVAGALQDLDRAVVIGARSFGKGLVQRPKDLTYGTQLKVTISRYYTPSGRCIQALDYQNRDEEGNAIRFSQEDYNEFKTRNGRKVYDGGGISPDIKLETSEYSSITNAILQQNSIFDYATDYYYSHDLSSPEALDLSQTDFNDFKKFLASTDFDYQTFTEKQLSELKKAAALEGFDDEIAQDYKEIEKTIQTSKQQAIEDKKEEIISLLSDEIIKRYFYKEGLYKYYVENNPEIRKARTVLNDPAEYNKILQ
ncbi:carboxyl-terminal processing protease [Salinimicrobium catena]|uniref:Carboxyl-terminal processing protease n=1 Tax=Salinimicrobium catena TaxID=390640 RepID=A0A1H5IKZ0_9FLAO|nr:S41 family peptidase [Salinimicrobium catena]SDK78533.1 carboxyl-terminal processing protease [Salinimicrobium catena]SEE40837.1 carboxyl-terminal processing protease [Salinimicrobium catena]